jgi:hypothetical protein
LISSQTGKVIFALLNKNKFCMAAVWKQKDAETQYWKQKVGSHRITEKYRKFRTVSALVALTYFITTCVPVYQNN